MNQRVNIQARIRRHIRILSGSLGSSKKRSQVLTRARNTPYQFFVFCLILCVPIYPRFASSIYDTTQYDFDRWNVDESTIIGSYIGSDDSSENAPLLESSNSFLSVNTILNDNRDVSGTNEVISYEVKPWDSVSSIAYDFSISTSSIYWANDFWKSHTLQPGDMLRIPPVSGILHTIVSWDTISAIAKKYDEPASKILEQNKLLPSDGLIAGKTLVIPGAVKVVYKPVVTKTPKKTTSTAKKAPSNNASWWGYSFAKYAASQYVSPGGQFQLNWRKPYSGVAGNCTWYVASYKNVNWRWNANQWMRNAKAKWHATGSTPKIWAVVAFEGRGYNPRYGHVGIVMDIKGSDIIVSDMNYRRPYEVTYRKVPISDRSITGYIYVD